MNHSSSVPIADSGLIQQPASILEAESAALTQKRISAHDYAELKRQIVQHGLLDKQIAYYSRRVAINLGMLALSIVLLFNLESFWLQIGNAIFLGFACVQIAFVAHNSGHRQVGRTARQDEMITLLHMGFLLGLSPSWWIDKHNVHHGQPNVDEVDPDINFPILAFSAEQAARKRGFGRWIVARQAFWYPLLITLVPFNMRMHSIIKLLGKEGPPVKHPIREAGVMSINWIIYLGLLISQLEPWQVPVFILIHHATMGLYLGTVFAANHKGMPVLAKDHGLTFFQLQIITSRNVRAHPLIDFLYGGLNYQIEHHLFPTMPQNKLREAQGFVKAFCARHAIPYCETGFFEAQKDILLHLHDVSKAARLRK